MCVFVCERVHIRCACVCASGLSACLPVCVCVTHHPGLVLVADLQVAHGLDDGHDGLDGVAVDHRAVLLALVF